MKRVIVVGSGAGGATIAIQLQGTFDVTILEAGKDFKPFRTNLTMIEYLRKTGLLFDERMVQLLFPAMKIRKTRDGMVLVNGIGTGGTTTISTANAVRKDEHLREIGIDLSAEYAELANDIPISMEHQDRWREPTKQAFDACRKMGLEPQVTPKMIDFSKCRRCGKCVFGCPYGAKWDTRKFVGDAVAGGARMLTGCKVRNVVMKDGKATGVQTTNGRFYPADIVILAAGGLATPVILKESGISCEEKLFVDPVLCVAAEWDGCRQNQELPMPFIVQRDGFIVSPYLDCLSFFFNRKWRIPAQNLFSLQIKMADANQGSITNKGLRKTLNPKDKARLAEGVALCREIFGELGISEDRTFLGTVNAGHPGGMLPLTAQEAETLHHAVLPENLYVADATLLPEAMGNPPSLTIIALAKRMGKIIQGVFQ